MLLTLKIVGHRTKKETHNLLWNKEEILHLRREDRCMLFWSQEEKLRAVYKHHLFYYHPWPVRHVNGLQTNTGLYIIFKRN